jgi:hypothetical protein
MQRLGRNMCDEVRTWYEGLSTSSHASRVELGLADCNCLVLLIGQTWTLFLIVCGARCRMRQNVLSGLVMTGL